MPTPTKTLLAASMLLLGACTSSEKMTPEEAVAKAMDNIPEELRIFDGYMQTVEKAKKTGADVQKMAESRRKILDQIEASTNK